MLDMRKLVLRCAVLVAAVLGVVSGVAVAAPGSFLALMTSAPAVLAVASDEGAPAVTRFGAVSAGGLARRWVAVVSARGGRIEEVAVEDGARFAVFDPNDCVGRTLPPGGECAVAVVAAPHGAKAATLDDHLLVQIDGIVREGEVTAWVR
jgi:hypothetical protein